MTQEQINIIEARRGELNEPYALYLLELAKHNEGFPQHHGCFCKSSNVHNYIGLWYQHYDNQKATANE